MLTLYVWLFLSHSLNRYSDKESVIHAIKTTSYVYGSSNTAGGLRAAISMFTPGTHTNTHTHTHTHTDPCIHTHQQLNTNSHTQTHPFLVSGKELSYLVMFVNLPEEITSTILFNSWNQFENLQIPKRVHKLLRRRELTGVLKDCFLKVCKQNIFVTK